MSNKTIQVSFQDELLETYKKLFEGRMPLAAYIAIHTAILEAYRAWPPSETIGECHNPIMYATALCKIVAREYDGEAAR